MNKQTLFLKAMGAQEYRRRAWVFSAFSLIREAPDAWRKDPYPYRLVQTPTGHFYVDPDQQLALVSISDGVVGEALYRVKEEVTITHLSGVPNYQIRNKDAVIDETVSCLTTYGNLLFNFICVIHPFGVKLNYIEGRVSPSQMEDLIVKRLKDAPIDLSTKNDQDIYVDEYLVFCDAMFYLAGFTQLCVPASTRKTMTAAPGIVELKERLLEENKDRLHDPAIIAKIDAELVAFDKAYMKGDLGEGFLISGKAYNIVRKKLFGMHGAEVGLDNGVDVDLIKNSLSQGWDLSKFPAMNNSLRAGSYGRGAETMLGGESVKWLLRASSNINVALADCGSRLGNTKYIDGDNYTWLTGFHVITAEGIVEVPSDEVAKTYVGRSVLVRSPMYCKLDKTDFCAVCVGARLAQNPTGLSIAVSEFGSSFLAISLKSSHGKALSLAKMNYKTAIQ